MSTVDYYDVLNVKRDAGRNEIKNAYRNLVRKHHPDKGGDPKYFKIITKAFNELYDPELRSIYDKNFQLISEAETDHYKLKKDFETYYTSSKLHSQLQLNGVASEEQAKIDFKKNCGENKLKKK